MNDVQWALWMIIFYCIVGILVVGLRSKSERERFPSTVSGYLPISNGGSGQALPVGPITECVLFEKLTDTHGIASITIPVTNEYKFETWSEGWVKRSLTAGDVITGVKRLVGKGCPSYNEIRVRP